MHTKVLALSHPVWVRGLKHILQESQSTFPFVAPRVGAWIETSRQVRLGTIDKVAPRVGAWIETKANTRRALVLLSHPVWVRGLKSFEVYPYATDI